jgi:hypothetical protein
VNTLQLLFVVLMALLALAALVTIVTVVIVRRQAGRADEVSPARGPRSTANRTAAIPPRRLVVTRAAPGAFAAPPSGADPRPDPRRQLWRDAAILLLAVLSIALIGLNILPAIGPQGEVATATGTPKPASPLVVGGPSASPGPSTKRSATPSRTPGPSPTPALRGTQAPAAGSSQRPAPTPRATPRPTPTPKPTHTPTPTPTPPAPTPTPPTPTPTPSVPASPSPSP